MPLGNLRFLRSALVLILISSFAALLMAQQVASRQRILQSIDNTRLTRLTGNTHPLARAEFDRGRAPDSLVADRMLLLLSRTPEQEAALAQLLDDQQTAGSANYRRWLTPEEFGQLFGASDADIQTITAWLQTQGFQVNRVSGSKNVIEFSGTAGQVRNSFHTELHKYAVSGKEYWANAADPQIPAALLPVVKGVVSLNNFPHKPQSHKLGAFSRTPEGTITPEFTVSFGSTTYYGLGPADFATIYNTNSLISAGTNGSGQTIAIIGETNINLQDVTDFRTFFSLTGGSTTVVLDGADPGIVADEEMEALLDVQWSGAVAPAASVKLVTAQTTTTTAGIFLAANYAIQQNFAGVLSLSYGSCEPYLGTSGNQYMQALWQQAAAQGITVLVSTGDEGSASCDYHATSDIAKNGLAVSGFASTPYNVAVGGTDFDDASAFSTYWNSTNNYANGSAKSYIPEQAWNGTCAATATASNLNVCPTWNGTGTPPAGISVDAGSGGASNCSTSTYANGQITCQSGTPKPSWQSGAGVPNDGVRDIPDVSLFAAWGDTSSKSFYVVCEADAVPGASCQKNTSSYFLPVGGTSAAAPSFAGMVALFNQKTGTRLGNINYLLYSIAAKSGSSCTSSGSEATSCVFNDVVKGNNSVPCVAGSPNCSQKSGTATGVLVDSSAKPAFTTTTGYDLATGLGSVNAANLATAIATAAGKFTATTTALTLNSATSTVTAKHGDPINVAVSVTPTTATGPISVQNSTGQGIDNAKLVSGSSAWTSTLFPGGNYTVKAHYPGDGTRAASDSNGVQVSISPEDSKTFIEVMNWDDSGHFLGYSASSLPYGSNYIIRMDVGDAAATLSNTAGLNSKCWNGTASCPTGTVTITQNGSSLDAGSYMLNSYGHAEDQTIQLSPGTYALAANYPGDTSYNPSSATANLTVTKAQTTTTIGVNEPVEFGSQTWIKAFISYAGSGLAPTSTPSLTIDGVLTNGLIPFGSSQKNQVVYGDSQVFNTLGSHTVSAQYPGDGNYQGSTSPTVTFTVGPATSRVWVTATPYTATPLVPVTLSASISSNAYAWMKSPTGTVTFYENGVPLGGAVPVSQFVASMQYTFTTLGTHNITVNYSGDTYFKPSSTDNPASVTVQQYLTIANLTVDVLPFPSVVNQPSTVRALLCGLVGDPAPTGTVNFSDGNTMLTDTVTYSAVPNSPSCMAASLTHTFTTTGTHNVSGRYSGDSIYTAQTAQNSLSVVTSLPVTVINVASYGTNVIGRPTRVEATVQTQAGMPPPFTGTVTFLDGGTPLTDNVTYDPRTDSGVLFVSTTHTFTTEGVHNIVVKYSGDTNYAAAQSASTPITIYGLIAFMQSAPTFNLGVSGGTQTGFIWVQNNGTSTANVTLTCTPELTSSSCSFNPSTLQLAPSVQSSSVLTFTVPALSAASHTRSVPWHGQRGLLLGSILACAFLATRKRKRLLVVAGVLTLALTMLSCGGGGSSSGGGGGGGNPPPTSKTYKFDIKATDGTNSDTQVVTVIVGNS